MKLSLLPLLLLLSPLPAIAIPINESQMPANYMVWCGKVINLDYLWGKGIVPTAPQTVPISRPTESRDVTDNKQRVAFENARSQIWIEYLKNVR